MDVDGMLKVYFTHDRKVYMHTAKRKILFVLMPKIFRVSYSFYSCHVNSKEIL